MRIKQKHLPELTESMNARFDALKWTREGKQSFVATGTFRDETLNLAIDLQTFKTSTRRYTVAHLAFERLIDGNPYAGVLKLNKNTFLILGALANAFKEQLKKLSAAVDIDAVYCVVLPGEEKKLPLFRRLLSGKLIGLALRTTHIIKSEHATVVASTDKQLSDEDWAALEARLMDLGKTVDD